jgi:hypothetical protein
MKFVLIILLLLPQGFIPFPGPGRSPAGGGGGGYSLISNTADGNESADSVTTSAIDTTGANLIVISLAWYAGTTSNCTPTDSNSNTWSALTQANAYNAGKNQLFYAYAPTVGSGHTFSCSCTSGTPALAVAAFSGAASAPFDQQSTAIADAGGETSHATGSITPTQDNELIISGFGTLIPETFSADSGMTIANQITAGVGGGLAYKIQTTAAAINVTWSWTTSTPYVALTIASFKAN